MQRPIRVLSVGTPILGNAVIHRNLCVSLKDSTVVEIFPRSVSDYWGVAARVMSKLINLKHVCSAMHRFRVEMLMSAVAWVGISREMRKLQPDVLHCHTQAHALLCHRIAARQSVVVSMDATARLLSRFPGYDSQMESLERLFRLEKRLFGYCSVVGGVSDWVTESLRRDYQVEESRVRLCPPSVDTECFRPSGNKITGDKLSLIFVGNDLERKGGTILLELMAEGLNSICNLTIVSGARACNSLPSGIEWRSGLAPNSKELVRCLQAADVFVLPTSEDCLGLAFIEAMACGLPLIGTGVMAVPELVQDGINGFCITPPGKATIREAIIALAACPELRRKMGVTGRRIACEHFSFAATQRVWETMFVESRQNFMCG